MRLIIALLVALLLAATATAADQEYTELETLKIQNLALKRQLVDLTYRLDVCAGKLAPFVLKANNDYLDQQTLELKQQLERKQ